MKQLFKGLALVGLGCVIVACTPTPQGGSPTSLERDTTAQVSLDERTGHIVFPLSQYDLSASASDIGVLNQALFLRIETCMNARSMPFRAGRVDPGPPLDDRNFGVWFEPGAQTWGLMRPPDPVAETFQADEDAGGERWSQEVAACNAEAESDPDSADFVPTQDAMFDSLAQKLGTTAMRAATRTAEWGAIRDKWSECLTANGLTAMDSETDWISVESQTALENGDPPERIIQLSGIEARCNNDLRVTQTAGDIVASFQVPLISANQVTLNDEKAEKDRYLAAAKKYIDQQKHG
ncbi:hypothetical protein MTE01_14440 [Microbacterium testaceum]|uniref:Uncharacterized protein n=1 Tax=Microbacterium testaceum TaxID=2033 RepID=A0A4Y3QKN4_MICTE|nr:hypothetical protein [Microbacterium testaceum]WJS91341.1 hypothetical protein NYQ11_01970 [Microbacterium testaceum]GEB45499.1 hypothetical protein MTE01_14440 [Microbacterium testaceum]